MTGKGPREVLPVPGAFYEVLIFIMAVSYVIVNT